MPPRAMGWIALLLAASLSPAGAASRCQLVMSTSVPVKIENLRPLVTASANGTDLQFIVDTGNSHDFLSPVAAAELKLPLVNAPPGYHITLGDSALVPKIATTKTFTLAGMTAHNVQFVVGGNDFRGGIMGILGQNIFRLADVDYDFANGVLRFVQPQHCGGRVLAYWAAPNQAVGVVNLRWTTGQQTQLLGKASVNGHGIEVMFDSGEWRTVLSLDAAKRIGITPDSPGVVPAGTMFGLGDKLIKVWSAPVAKFEIGGETIRRSHVLIGDIRLQDADMLLGADFFLAHRIYVANRRDKLYFTYNGGPVFDVTTMLPTEVTIQASNTAAALAQPVASAGADAAPPPTAVSDAPTDAAGFLRRGLAYAARGELQQALADLTRAADLDPHDPECLYQRGLVYWRNRQPQLALQDFNAALALDPNDYQVHLARARLELPKLHAGIEGDLDAVDRMAPPDVDLRLALGGLYHAIGQYAAAVHQYDLWIESHEDDLRVTVALSTRCGLQAGANIDLDRALDDCDKALAKLPASDRSAVLSNRSLVYLRLGRFDRTIADDTASIQLRPQSPYPYYLRGLAELRKGLTARGRADLAAAQELQPDIARHYAVMGLTP